MYIGTGQDSSRERTQEKNLRAINLYIAVRLYTYVPAIYPFIYVPVVSITIISDVTIVTSI